MIRKTNKISNGVNKFPSAKEIIEEAKKRDPKADINRLHALTFKLMMQYKDIYYYEKVKSFLSRSSMASLPTKIKLKIEKELLKPMKGGDIWYSNFMEEASRRISQTFQTISGNIAELCVEKELIETGLKEKVHYTRKREHADLIIYYPQIANYLKKHRIEIKNVSLRERGTRGLKFDGDSMIGFFNNPSEFTDTNINIIHEQCKETGGYCYIPPVTLKKIEDKVKNKRFKSNKEFILDVKRFIDKGII